MKPTDNSKKVCVTGATGFIASHLVATLLRRGYHVTGTVRNAVDTKRYAHLLALAEGSLGSLELVSADMGEEGSYDVAVSGCEYVCHVASPVIFKSKDPQKEVVDVAVHGTVNVFRSILRAKCAKRVIMTSSRVAIVFGKSQPDHIYTESDWSSFSNIHDAAYPVSKTLAERAAWEIYNDQPQDGSWRFELVTMLPGVALGPVLCRQHLHTSPEIIYKLMSGQVPLVPDLEFEYVDVRDAADAHVAAIENADVTGRYILLSDTYTLLKTSFILHQMFPNRKGFPTRVAPRWLLYILSFVDSSLPWGFLKHNLGVRTKFSTEKAKKELGIQFRPATDSMFDTARSLIENKYVK